MSFYTHDNTLDSPLNNFATLNPNDRNVNSVAGTWGSSALLVDGNLTYSSNTSSHSHHVYTVFPKGIWYFEIRVNNSSFSFNIQDERKDSSNLLSVHTGYGAYTRIYAICIDSTTGKLWYKIDSKITEDVVTGNSPQKVLTNFQSFCFTVTDSWAAYAHSNTFNFGQDPSFGGRVQPSVTYQDANGLGQFYYEPPDGALALCTANIPSGPIDIANDDVPSDYMKAVTWTGGQLTNNQVTGVGFQPDLIWSKERNGTNYHRIHDSVRGASAGQIHTNHTAAQNPSYPLGSFDSDGFTISSALVPYDNITNNTYVAWCWKAAGAPADGQAKIINEDGSDGTMSTADLASAASATITPSKVSANRKSGFSIVKYKGILQGSTMTSSGSSVCHGLSTTPDLIIIKCTSHASNNWTVWSSGYGHTGTLYLNTTDQVGSPHGNRFVGASSETFSVGYYGVTGYQGNDYIAYCWHSVTGYSKFGSYVGNGSADGPFIECGFRPAWVMVKRIDTGNGWEIHDSARDTYNPSGDYLVANESSYSFGTISEIDFLSNGFKIRTNVNSTNNGSGTYIYMAFAEAPMNAPATAR